MLRINKDTKVHVEFDDFYDLCATYKHNSQTAIELATFMNEKPRFKKNGIKYEAYALSINEDIQSRKEFTLECRNLATNYTTRFLIGNDYVLYTLLGSADMDKGIVNVDKIASKLLTSSF